MKKLIIKLRIFLLFCCWCAYSLIVLYLNGSFNGAQLIKCPLIVQVIVLQNLNRGCNRRHVEYLLIVLDVSVPFINLFGSIVEPLGFPLSSLFQCQSLILLFHDFLVYFLNQLCVLGKELTVNLKNAEEKKR